MNRELTGVRHRDAPFRARVIATDLEGRNAQLDVGEGVVATVELGHQLRERRGADRRCPRAHVVRIDVRRHGDRDECSRTAPSSVPRHELNSTSPRAVVEREYLGLPCRELGVGQRS
jgi:hypothetical protein